MRIGIDGRPISHPQPGGYKSYVTNLVQGLAEADGENSYIIYLDREMAGGPLAHRQNLQVQIVRSAFPGRWWREQVLLPRRLAQDRVTVGHFPTNAGPILCRSRYVLTILDTMRFLDMPQLPRPYSARTVADLFSLMYMRALTARAARRAACIITISQSSKIDILNQLGASHNSVRVIYPAPSDVYGLVPDRSSVDECRRIYQLGDKFLLAFGSTAPRKNTARLLRAYARLATDTLSEHGLALVVSPASARDEVHRLARSCGVEGKVTLLTGVTDSQLCLLYNAAQAFVLPSLYEGFGLPAVEAMACGTAVVAANVSSIPEVVGDAAALVDPSDEIALSQVISRVVTDHGLRRDLAQRGLRRASLFSPRKQAVETLAVYREVASL